MIEENPQDFCFSFCRSAPKETRDKANLMLSEKKLRQELEEARNELKKLQNYTKTLKKKTNEDEVNRFHLKSKQEKNISFFSLFQFRIQPNYVRIKTQFEILKRI